jgi:hypothetical protein
MSYLMCRSFSIQRRVGNGVEWKLKDGKKPKEEEEEVEEEQYRGEHLIRLFL